MDIIFNTGLMKYYVLFILFFKATLLAQTQYEFIESDRLGERQLKIQLPRNYIENTDQFYPLIVTLDGDYLFEPVAGNVDFISYWDDMPEAIVVGVNQDKDRAEDLKISDEDYFPIMSGAKFYEFLGAELIPYITENYRIGNFKVIVGHGQSANFINFFSFKKDPLFQAYIAMSPTLSPYMSDNLAKKFMSIKEPLFYYMSTSDEDYNENREGIKELDTKLQSIESKTLFYEFENFEGHNHYSLVASAIPEALQHIFKTYRPISRTEYKDNILKLESSPVDYLIEKYDMIESFFGIKKQILLNDFRAINAAINSKENLELFKDLAKLARENYPKSLLFNYYMGRYYEATDNPRKAIKVYQEAFVYDEIDGITIDDLLDQAERLKRENDY